MTSRERFLKTMNYGNPDRVALLDEGIREEVFECWYHQGLMRNTRLSDIFTIDPSKEIDIDFNIDSFFSKIPKSIEELDKLKTSLDSKRLIDFANNILQEINHDVSEKDIFFLTIHSGFFLTMGVNNWHQFTDVISLLTDQPEFVGKYLMTHSELTIEILKHILPYIKAHAVIFSEPICGNEGPLISPGMYEDLILKSYKPIIDLINGFGIKTVILRTYANSKLLLPLIMKYGFNTLWACETNNEKMNYKLIRKEYGTDLRLIGGIDLDVLRMGKENIKIELEKIVPPLLNEGGYIPIADGRVRSDINYKNYFYYRKLLEKMVTS